MADGQCRGETTVIVVPSLSRVIVAVPTQQYIHMKLRDAFCAAAIMSITHQALCPQAEARLLCWTGHIKIGAHQLPMPSYYY
eukprot:scaffold185815_cov20-Prasinocladus_malaysianus.AAC.1